jgi:hypothetical protein
VAYCPLRATIPFIYFSSTSVFETRGSKTMNRNFVGEGNNGTKLLLLWIKLKACSSGNSGVGLSAGKVSCTD